MIELSALLRQMEESKYICFVYSNASFPRLLRETAMRLGIVGHPEYRGRDIMHQGKKRCLVTVYIGASLQHGGWCSMTIGESFKEGCHTVAQEALRTMCSFYREEIQQTPMKFFPPSFQTHEERRNQEKLVEDQRLGEDPTMPYLILYLLAL